MSRALIGYTGLVGGVLSRKSPFDFMYNSKNINEIKGKNFDCVICAGASGVKWKANQEPDKDLKNIMLLIDNLKTIHTNKFILISTVDVYKNPLNVEETTMISMKDLHPYGQNRRYLEEFVQNRFENHLIVRLPALFGEGLRKNFIYDLIHNHCLHWTHKDSSYQFYNLDNLWKDINIAEKNNIHLLNITSEPITAKVVAKESLNLEFQNVTQKAPVHYDVKSKYCELYGGNNGYLYLKEKTITDLKEFIKRERANVDTSKQR